MTDNNYSNNRNKTKSGAGRSYNSTGSRKNNNTVKSGGGYPSKNSTSGEKSALRVEITILVAITVSVLLFLSNFGLCGIIGSLCSALMFGLFGLPAYILPVLLAITVIFMVANTDEGGANIRAFSIVTLFVNSTVLTHIILLASKELKFTELYSYCYENHTGGGFVGGVIAGALSALFGKVGATVIIVILMLIMVIILSGKSLIGSIKEYRDENKDFRQQSMEHNREIRQQNREIRQREKIDRQRQIIEENERRREALRRGEKPRKIHQGIDFEETNLLGNRGDSKNPSDKVGDIREIKHQDITFEGLEPSYSGHVEIDDTGSDQYSYYEETDKKTKVRPSDRTFEKHGNEERFSTKDGFGTKDDLGTKDEENNDYEFTPKERFEVSEEAKAVMRRNPYDLSGRRPAKEETASANDRANTEKSYTGRTNNAEYAEKVYTEKVNTEKDNSQASFSVAKPKRKMVYRKPNLNLLNSNSGAGRGDSVKLAKEELMETADKLQKILEQFNVSAKVTNVSKGPSVTRYELQPEYGTRLNKITSLSDEIKLGLAAQDIRIEAPIPGKAAVGIEVPNKKRESVFLRELIESRELKANPSKLAFAAGKDISGKIIIADIAKMPHMIVAGTTGSGKSVFTNSIIMSILFRATPDEVKFIMVDPKLVELAMYNGIPHLLSPVVTDPKKAAAALNWAVAEMENRYKKFLAAGTKDLAGYNNKVETGEYTGEDVAKMPQIVIFIDELADLMMVAAKDVEVAICRLAQKARAAGIHLIIATQRPSVDVVTGLIKSNIPSRVALLVSSAIDSRTILDSAGAEKLLGNGDLLFYPAGYPKPVRLQGAYVDEKEIVATIDYIKSNCGEVEYSNELESKMSNNETSSADEEDDGRDSYFIEAGKLVIEKQKGSTSMLQRYFRIGFNRAARIMEQLYDAGVVGQEETNKPRQVLMTMDEFEENFAK